MSLNIMKHLVLSGSEQQKAVLRLLAVSNLINQAVGDALSGLLLVEAILQYKGWSIHNWSELYHDLPSRQLKVYFLDYLSRRNPFFEFRFLTSCFSLIPLVPHHAPFCNFETLMEASCQIG